jgi:hypothetical protein
MLALVVPLVGCGRLGFGPGGDGAIGDRSGELGGGGEGTPAGSCGTTVALADDFDDGVAAPEWTVLTGTNLTLTETSGVLQIAFASNVPASQNAGYVTTNAMDFTGTCVEAEVAMIGNPATLAQATIRIGSSTDCGEIEIASGMIHASQHRGASITLLPAIAFDPVAHRFLRMRESAGMWSYDASPNGSAWNVLGTVADTFASSTSTTFRVTAGSGNAINDGGIVQYASVRILAP